MAHLIELLDDPRFTVLDDDPQYYDYWARALVTGDWTPPVGRTDPLLQTTPFAAAPGYPHFLAVLYWLTGCSYLGARVLQMALGLCSCFMLYLLGRRVFSPWAGIAASALMASYWAFPFYEGTFTAPVAVIFCYLALALALTSWIWNPTLWRALLCGFVLGTSILFRSNGMLFGPAIVGCMLYWLVKTGKGRVFLPHAAAITAATFLAIMPVTIRNYMVSGEFVLVNTHAGMSLLFGNYPDADGTTTMETGLRDSVDEESWNPFILPLLKRNTERELGVTVPLSHTEYERVHARRAWEYMRQNPARILRLMLRKALLFWGPREITSNTVIECEKSTSHVFRYLPGFSMIAALFVLGLLLFLHQGRGRPLNPGSMTAVAIIALIFIYFLSFLPFTVNARFRAMILPYLLLFGGHGLASLLEAASTRHWDRVIRRILVLGIAGVLFQIEFTHYEPFVPAFYFGKARAYEAVGRIDEAIATLRQVLNDYDSAKARDNLGYMLTRKGEYEEARRHFEHALELDPQYAMAHCNLGYLLENEGAHQEAFAHYEAAIDYQPRLRIARNNYGNLLLELGRVDDAIAEFESVIDIDPRDQFGAYNLGRALMVKGEHEAAVAQFTKAAENDPANPDVHNNMGLAYSELGRAEEALACYRKALDLDPGNAKAHNNLGLEFAKQGKSDEAIENYRKAIDLDPVFTLPRNNLANLLARLGRVDEAVSTLEAALRANPKDEFAHYNLGNILAQQGRIEEALGHYQKAMDNAPLDPNVPNNYGLAMAALGRSQQAIALYRRAIEIAPEYVEAHNNLGYELARIGEYDEAARAYEEALRLNPRYALACNNYGNLLLDQGKTEPALRLFTKAKEANPNDPYADYNLGNLYARQGDWDQAIERFTEAMQHNALDPAVPNNLGLALANVRRYDEAVARFREALERDPQYANAYFNLGNTMATMGRLDDAAQNLRKALELAPNHAQAQENLRRVLQAQGR